MNIAFYAPLKPPHHATPSGDRRMARLLMKALEQAGHFVELASPFRSYDKGDKSRQRRLKTVGEHLAKRLIRRYQNRPKSERPDAWFTYHMYHKAPDWLGPCVAKALNIPYIIAEASFAPKQEHGPWAFNHQSLAEMIGCADTIIGFNPDDRACLQPLLSPSQKHITVRPFLDNDTKHSPLLTRANIADRYDLNPNMPWMCCVAMMRTDQKLKSYGILAKALDRIQDQPWHLLVIGSGPGEQKIKELFHSLAHRITWLGFQDEADLANFYHAADVFVWPAIKESYGMVFLEAMSFGLPIVAGRSLGVANIVNHEKTGLLTKQGNVQDFAQATKKLLTSPDLRASFSAQAKLDFQTHHALETMSKTLDDILQDVVEQRMVA